MSKIVVTSSLLLLSILVNDCSAAVNCTASYDCVVDLKDENLVCHDRVCKCKEGYVPEEYYNHGYSIACYKIDFTPLVILIVTATCCLALIIYTIHSMRKHRLACFA